MSITYVGKINKQDFTDAIELNFISQKPTWIGLYLVAFSVIVNDK